MFKTYKVTLNFTSWFAAGIPKNPDLLETYLQVKGHGPESADPLDAGELAEEIAEPSTDKWSVGFKGDKDGIYYEGRCVKAHLKDCANVLQKTLEIKALKSKLADRVTVQPERIRLLRNGATIEKADGNYQLPITVMTRQGPRTSIKQVDYVDSPEMRFTLVVLADKVITEDTLRAIFEYGGTIKGMGQDRGLSMGRFHLVELKEIRSRELFWSGVKPRRGLESHVVKPRNAVQG